MPRPVREVWGQAQRQGWCCITQEPRSKAAPSGIEGTNRIQQKCHQPPGLFLALWAIRRCCAWDALCSRDALSARIRAITLPPPASPAIVRAVVAAPRGSSCDDCSPCLAPAESEGCAPSQPCAACCRGAERSRTSRACVPPALVSDCSGARVALSPPCCSAVSSTERVSVQGVGWLLRVTLSVCPLTVWPGGNAAGVNTAAGAARPCGCLTLKLSVCVTLKSPAPRRACSACSARPGCQSASPRGPGAAASRVDADRRVPLGLWAPPLSARCRASACARATDAESGCIGFAAAVGHASR